VDEEKPENRSRENKEIEKQEIPSELRGACRSGGITGSLIIKKILADSACEILFAENLPQPGGTERSLRRGCGIDVLSAGISYLS
jgi:hypothetical protein